MSFDVLIGVIQIILVATTPLVFAAIGELVTEKTGVLNLGVEGMMLVGAVTAFVTFGDGNVEAVMAVYKYKDGKIVALETGATPMPK